MKHFIAILISLATLTLCTYLTYQQRVIIRNYENKIKVLHNQIDSISSNEQQLMYEVARYEITLTELIEQDSVAGDKFIQILKNVE